MKNIYNKTKISITILAVLFSFIYSCDESTGFNEFANESFNQNTPVANFDYQIDGQDITFTNNSVNADVFEWDFGDASNPGESTDETPGLVTYTFDDGEDRMTKVILSARNSDANVTNQFEADIAFIQADFIISSIVENVVSFESTSSQAVSYLWDFGDGSGTSTEANPTYTYSTFETFTVTLTVTDSFGNTDEIVNEEVVIALPGAGTFAAEIIAGDFDADAFGTSIQNPWAVNPDNSSDFNFWDNIALESVVQSLDGGSDKGSTSGTSNLTPGSLKLDRASKRAYQAIKVESDVDYSITAYVKNKSAASGDVVGTVYILGYEPSDETIILTDNIVSFPVVASDTGVWDEATFEFTATTTFSFDQDIVDNQTDDILTSVNEEWIVFYFVPNLSTAGEVNLDDVSIQTSGF